LAPPVRLPRRLRRRLSHTHTLRSKALYPERAVVPAPATLGVPVVPAPATLGVPGGGALWPYLVTGRPISPWHRSGCSNVQFRDG
jgi:hypothetical protein